jgi:hypothetical protein
MNEQLKHRLTEAFVGLAQAQIESADASERRLARATNSQVHVAVERIMERLSTSKGRTFVNDTRKGKNPWLPCP